MDFEDVTDIPGSQSTTQVQDPFLKPEDSGPFPTIATSEPENGIQNAFGASKKLMAILIVSIFTTLTIGSITAFVVIRTTSANTKANQEDPYERYAKMVIPTKTPVPTAPALPAVETDPSSESSASEEAELNDGSKATDPWEIIFDEPLVTLDTIDDKKAATLSASLFGPLAMGTVVCVENARNTHQYFTMKKTGQVYERICQEIIDSKAARFSCFPYEPIIGIQIQELLLPASNCTNGAAEIEPGIYAMYSKVFYDCNIDASSPRSITESDCENSIDINSEELTVE